MRYIDFDIKNPKCIHCMISDRAYASIITEVMANGQNETGGVLLGYIHNRTWFVMESVDPGIDTVNEVAFFRWDGSYVNYQAERLSKIYHHPMTILGFWHRHPASMDYFSGQDEQTIRSNLIQLKEGLISMLVNIDPKLRMTFYYCNGNDIMPIRYDVGNKYFPVELLKYADAEELSKRALKQGSPMEIHYEQVINLDNVASKKPEAKPAFSEPAEPNGIKELKEQLNEINENIKALSKQISEILPHKSDESKTIDKEALIRNIVEAIEKQGGNSDE